MMDDGDRLVARVLEKAKGGAAPDAAALARAFAGIERQLGATELGGETTELAAPLRADLGPTRAGALRHWTVSKWLVWGAATGITGFFLGVEYAHRAPAAPVDPVAVARVDSAVATLPSLTGPRATAPATVAPGRPLEVPEAPSVRALDASRNSRGLSRARPAREVSSPARPSAVLTEPEERFGLDAVLERLVRAQRAQRDGFAGEALALLDEIDRRAAPDAVRLERLVTRALVACDLGDVAGARRVVLALGDEAGGSIYASRLAESCVGGELGASIDEKPRP